MSEHNADSMRQHPVDPRRSVRVEEVRQEFHPFPGRGTSPAMAQAAHQQAQFQGIPPNPPSSGVASTQAGHHYTHIHGPDISPRATQTTMTSTGGPWTQVKSFAEQNPEFYSFELPSRFAFYPFKTISAKYLTGLHISKINRANTEGRIQHLVEALSSTLEPGISAFDLTPADFYYFMYWHRVNSYPKSPMKITAQCQNPKHIQDVLAQKLPEKSLDIVDILNKTTLDVKDFNGLPEGMQQLAEHLDLDVERMRDTIELSDHVLDSEDGDPEFVYLAQYAAFLRRKPECETLLQRVEVVRSMSPDTISELDEYIHAVSTDAYGVKEYANVRCTECGASTRVQVSLEAHHFLPQRN